MIPEFQIDLEAHQRVCEELLEVAGDEHEALRDGESYQVGCHDSRRKDLLVRLNKFLNRLQTHRLHWQKLDPRERAEHPQISRLIRRAQELAMKVIVLDRENEQALLRRGFLPARQLARSIPAQNHFVSDLYRRHISSPLT
jgi:hypothetical protein